LRVHHVLAATTPGALGLPALGGVLTAMEAGVPIPIPADLVLLAVGERAAAGAFPVLAAVLVLELAAVVGTGALFLLARGPGGALIARLGPKVGLTAERRARATDALERRGRRAMAVGRATPGLRTITVLGAAGTAIPARRAIPALALGSSVFLQLHLVLGYVLGPVARDAIEAAKGPALAVLAALAVAGVAVWLARRGRRSGAQAATEACCPVCLALGAVLPDRAGLKTLA
jgi:membrane protein DedA with SNARE-associated domain